MMRAKHEVEELQLPGSWHGGTELLSCRRAAAGSQASTTGASGAVFGCPSWPCPELLEIWCDVHANLEICSWCRNEMMSECSAELFARPRNLCFVIPTQCLGLGNVIVAGLILAVMHTMECQCPDSNRQQVRIDAKHVRPSHTR